jgi:hypothetical protein
MTKQPRDDGNTAIPVLGYRYRSGQALAISSSSARSAAFAASTRVISVYSSVDTFIEIGDSSVTAALNSSAFIPAETYIDIALTSSLALRDQKYLAAVASSSGTLYISERV